MRRSANSHGFPEGKLNSYRKLCTEFYDIDKPNAPAESFAFYRDYARRATGPILEPMCGSGRFLLPLLEEGFPIDGVDASGDMLQACREKARQRGLAPRLHEQFLHELDLPQRYGLVIIPGGSFGLVTDPAQVRDSLGALHTHMLPGATLVLTIELLLPQPPPDEPWGGRWVTRPDGARIVISWLRHYDPAARVQHGLHRYELIKDGRLLETEWEEYDQRFYEVPEFSMLLASAGFTGIQTRKAHAQAAPDETDDTVVFECVRA